MDSFSQTLCWLINFNLLAGGASARTPASANVKKVKGQNKFLAALKYLLLCLMHFSKLVTQIDLLLSHYRETEAPRKGGTRTRFRDKERQREDLNTAQLIQTNGCSERLQTTACGPNLAHHLFL